MREAKVTVRRPVSEPDYSDVTVPLPALNGLPTWLPVEAGHHGYSPAWVGTVQGIEYAVMPARSGKVGWLMVVRREVAEDWIWGEDPRCTVTHRIQMSTEEPHLDLPRLVLAVAQAAGVTIEVA